jgi:thiol:disulfide interchange protein DsbD
LTSFTCTFAIAGSLLVGAAQGEVYWPVVGMLAFGTAFASPFFVLAMIPGLLKKLPKSGGWMNSVKVVMGLLELGAAVKFFSIGDPGQVLFDHVTVMLIWFVLAMVTAIYLFGWFRLPHDTVTQQISPWLMLLGISFFVLAGMLLVGVTMPDRGGAAVRQILAFAPARFEAAEGKLGPSLKHHGLEFALYLDKALPVAQQQNRPLLLDFTGVNCANCRYMELEMARPEWKERLAKFVGVQLYVDVPQIPTIHDVVEGERLRAANEALELKLLQDSSMPAYAVLTPDGKTVLAKYIGAESATTAGTFVKFLDEGWGKWEQHKAGKLAQRNPEMATNK